MNVIELLRKTCLGMACMITFTGLQAQTVTPSLDKKVHVPAKEVDILALGDIITAQTGLILSFNAQRIIAQKQLWLPKPSYSIHQLLSMIKDATGAEYTIYRKHIIFHRTATDNTAAQTAVAGQTKKQVPSSGTTQQQPTNTGFKQANTPVNKLSGNVARQTSVQPVLPCAKTSPLSGSHTGQEAAVRTARSSNDSNKIQPDITSTDDTNARSGTTTRVIPGNTDQAFVNNIANDSTTTDKQQAYLLTYITSPAIAINPVAPASPTLLTVHSLTQRQNRRHNYERPGLFKPFVSTAFAADEVLYANLQARAGVTLLYGIAAWSSNFSASGFRYGAGSSYPFKNGWLIQLEATTGKFSKVTPIFMDDTATIKHPLTSNSRLQRISLLAQKSITTHWSVYAGPVFNHLKSTYYTINGQVSPAIITQRSFATKKEYTIITPPYTLTNSPSEEPEDVKTWIGLQIGINYRF